MLDHEFGHLCFGRRIHISGHSDFGFLILDRLSFLLECKLIVRRLLVLRNLVALQFHPLLLPPSSVMQTNLAQ